LATREALFDVMEQIAEERIAARPIVEKLLSRGEEVWDEEIPESWRTAGFVQELTAAGAGILETDPSRCLNFTQLALAVVSSIPAETYPSPVQQFIGGRAWKEIGLAHRYLDKYDAALRAYDAAQRAFACEYSLAHEMARTQYGQASVLIMNFRDDEGLRSLNRTLDLFRDFRDEQSLVHCEIAKSVIRYHAGDIKTALALTLELLTKYSVSDDLETLVVLYNNAGHFQVLLGNTEEALIALARASEIAAVLGRPCEVDRAEWGVASVLLSSGDFDTAIALLYRLRNAFLSRQMPEEAGLIALQIVDALVATERREEALRLTEQVLAEFISANGNRHAVTALSYLRDLLPSAKLPRQAVNHVRSFVERLRTEPACLFIPRDSEE
jgi:tetratricopeptide (TPR) repeat protein